MATWFVVEFNRPFTFPSHHRLVRDDIRGFRPKVGRVINKRVLRAMGESEGGGMVVHVFDRNQGVNELLDALRVLSKDVDGKTPFNRAEDMLEEVIALGRTIERAAQARQAEIDRQLKERAA